MEELWEGVSSRGSWEHFEGSLLVDWLMEDSSELLDGRWSEEGLEVGARDSGHDADNSSSWVPSSRGFMSSKAAVVDSLFSFCRFGRPSAIQPPNSRWDVK
ncbi:MAG: hypothetical protein L6R39_000578 [Caloplaca ligustica]|nr:MAG: hypothetical protein L6R39_000578 [Caloplaca ligustica]